MVAKKLHGPLVSGSNSRSGPTASWPAATLIQQHANPPLPRPL